MEGARWPPLVARFRAEAVAGFLVGILRQAPATIAVELMDLNGVPGFVASADGSPVIAGVVDSENGLIFEIRFVRNPDKLRSLGQGAVGLQ